MRPTGVALLQSLYDAIHPPLINKTKTRQLLQVMSRSFQQHIDQRASASEKAMKQHFNSIFSHPTFVLPPRESDSHAHALFNEFQNRLALGSLNWSFFAAYIEALVKEPSRAEAKVIVSKTVAMLETFTQPQLKDFQGTTNSDAIQNLMRLLILEGEDDVARRLALMLPHDALLSSYILECLNQRGVESAMLAVLAIPQSRLDKLRWAAFRPICIHLLEHPPDACVVAFDTYDSFINAMHQRQGSTKKSHLFILSTLELLHPNEKLQSADSALRLLKIMDNSESFKTKRQFQMYELRTPPLRLALKTAEILIQADEYDSADWVLAWLERHYSEELHLKKLPRQTTMEMRRKTSQPSDDQLLGQLSGLLSNT